MSLAVKLIQSQFENADTTDAAEIKQAAEELTQASHKIAELMYQQAAAEQAAQQQQHAGTDGVDSQPGTEGGSGKPDDDVIDAEYEDTK